MPIEINENEYIRLYNQKIDKETFWKFKSDLSVNLFINDFFDENKFLHSIIFDTQYNILKNNSDNWFLDGLGKYFDDSFSVSFKENVSLIEHPEVITGIITFPCIQWSTIDEVIHEIPDEWEIFIINPILMRYSKGSVGLFLTPKYGDDFFIDECNSFIRLKTGYPLFLDYSTKESVPEIHFFKAEFTLEGYVEDMKKYGKNKGLSKLLDFWINNECVSVVSFEYNFIDYKENLPFLVWHSIDFKDIRSHVPFELVHEETGEILGPFLKFNLDIEFKLTETDKGVLSLSQNQVDDLAEGKYDFRFVS